jgi:cell surface protein SprA
MNMTNLYRKSELLQKIINDGRGGGRVGRRTVRGRAGGRTGGSGSKTKNDSRLAKKFEELEAKKKKLDAVDVKKLSPEELEEHEKELEKVTKKLERKEPRLERQNERIENQEEREEKYQEKYGKTFHPITGFFGRALMSVRTISGTYTLNDGMLLPGFNQEAKLFGMNTNTFGDGQIRGFALGQQQRDLLGQQTGFRYAPYAADRGFIVDTSSLNTQHTVQHSQNYNLRASLEPLKDLKIDYLNHFCINQ